MRIIIAVMWQLQLKSWWWYVERKVKPAQSLSMAEVMIGLGYGADCECDVGICEEDDDAAQSDRT